MKWKLTLVEIGLVVLLVGIGVAGRLLWHPEQLTPVAAAALFAGFCLRSRLLALCVPLLTMAISDAYIGIYEEKIMAAVYAGLCFPVLLSFVLKKDVSIARIAGCSVLSSVVFFVLSNGAEWMWGSLYARDAEGLRRCFEMAIPFFRHTLVGDLLWSSIFFAAHGLIVSRWRLEARDFDRFDKPVPVKVRK